MPILHALCIRLGKSCGETIDLLSKMQRITALVDVEMLTIIIIHCTTIEKYDAKIDPQVACKNAADLRSLKADPSYDSKPFRDESRRNDAHPLIYSSFDRAPTSIWTGNRYHHRSISETVFLLIKSTFGSTVHV